MSSNHSTARLNLVQEAIRSGNVTVVLGPNTARGTINHVGDEIPSLDSIIDSLCRQKQISVSDQRILSHDEIIDYCTRNDTERQQLDGSLAQILGAKRPSRALHALTGLVWHRVYTFDISNAIELAYRHNAARSQTPRIIRLSDPVTIDVDVATDIEIIKLFGDVNDLSQGCRLNTPRYQERWARSPWLDILADDLKTRPTLFCGESGDGPFLLNHYRQLRRGERGGNLVVFATPDLAPLQSRILDEDNVLQLQLSFSEFADAIRRVFPNGRTIIDILADTSDIQTKENPGLAISLLNDFDVLTRAAINTLVKGVGSRAAEFVGFTVVTM